MIDRYTRAPYREGGRGPVFYDCWGLCIEVRHKVFGLPLLPSLARVGKDCIRENTKAYHELKLSMVECNPQPGAIAAVFRGKSMLHVGVVIKSEGRLKVLDTNPGGPCIRTTGDFESAYSKVVYYRDN